MFDSLTNLFNNMSDPIKTVVVAILYIVAAGFAAKPAINAMKDIGDKRWVSGVIWLAAVIAIFAVPTAFLFLVDFGQTTGNQAGEIFQ